MNATDIIALKYKEYICRNILLLYAGKYKNTVRFKNND